MSKKINKYKDWLNEDLGAENPTPPVDNDLEDIRYFKGSVAQMNDWLNKKLESQGKTWNPYADMKYKHPVNRNEKDDSLGYQDYKHGKDTHPENAKATRKRGEAVNEAKEYDLGLTNARKYEMTLGKAISKLDGIKAYNDMANSYGRSAVNSMSDRIRISQYGNPLDGTGTDNTDALKKILKKADSNLDVNTITNNFSAIATRRSKHDQDKDIWYYDIDKKVGYHKAKKMGMIAQPPVTDMSPEVVADLMDMMAGYTSDANPLADVQWNSLDSFMKAASDYIKGSNFKKFQKSVEKKYPLLESTAVRYKKGDKIEYQLTHKGGVGKYADAMSKSKYIETGVIKKRTKSLSGFKYELTSGLELYGSEILGLAENQNINNMKDSNQLNEISTKAGLEDVIKGRTSAIEGIPMSKDMAQGMMDFIKMSPYGRKYGKHILKGRIASIIGPANAFGIERYLSSKAKKEFKEIYTKYGPKRESVEESMLNEAQTDINVLASELGTRFPEMSKMGSWVRDVVVEDDYPDVIIMVSGMAGDSTPKKEVNDVLKKLGWKTKYVGRETYRTDYGSGQGHTYTWKLKGVKADDLNPSWGNKWDIDKNKNESTIYEAEKGSEEKENREKLKGYAEKINKAGDAADKARAAAKKAEEKKDGEAEAVAKLQLQKANAQAAIAKVDARLFKHKLSKEKKKDESVKESTGPFMMFEEFVNEGDAGLPTSLKPDKAKSKAAGHPVYISLDKADKKDPNLFKYNGKLVDYYSIEIDGIDRRDHPDYVDAFVSHAEYWKNGKALTDEEIEDMEASGAFDINQFIHDNQLGY